MAKRERKPRRAKQTKAKAEWWLADMAPRIFGPGNYDATVAATDLTSGASCCAWEIRKRASTVAVLSDSKRSQHIISDEQRGYVAGALGAIASFEGSVKLAIWSNSRYIERGLNGDALKWKSDGWRRSDGKPAKNPELWDLILRLIEQRQMTVTGEYESKESHIPYERVMALAKAACE